MTLDWPQAHVFFIGCVTGIFTVIFLVVLGSAYVDYYRRR